MEKMESYGTVVARILLAMLFVIMGLTKIASFSGIQGYMVANGVPGILLAPTILFEVGGGIALIIGWQTRAMAVLLAGFSVLTALIFHRNIGDPSQLPHFLKNVSIAGGMLVLALHGAGSLSLDGRSSASKATGVS